MTVLLLKWGVVLYLVDCDRHLDGTILIDVLFILAHDCFGAYSSFSLKENGVLVTSKSVLSEYYPVYNRNFAPFQKHGIINSYSM